MTVRATLVALLAVLVVGVPTAAAQAPANDARAAATPVQPGVAVTGTTAGSTLEAGEARVACAGGPGSVWYRVDAGPGPVVVVLEAEQDTVLEVGGTCTTTMRGRASRTVQAAPGNTLLVRVSPSSVAEPGPFTLRAGPAAPVGGETPEPLSVDGATGVVDPLDNARDVYTVDLQRGVDYRFRLSREDGECAVATLLGPGVTDDYKATKTLICRGFEVVRPSVSGRYTLRLDLAPILPARARYAVAIERASADDVGAGRRLPERRTVRGDVGRAADQRDLFRFTVGRSARVNLALRTARDARIELRLYRGNRRLDCRCSAGGSRSLTRALRPGRYRVVVQAQGFSSGDYALRRATRPR